MRLVSPSAKAFGNRDEIRCFRHDGPISGLTVNRIAFSVSLWLAPFLRPQINGSSRFKEEQIMAIVRKSEAEG
jgi:hypothetical protein